MSLQQPKAGQIITFYSYKGGTGRSMALANVACLLARGMAKTSQRVLVMDWDLEAPGLHRFFSAKSDLLEYEKQPGVIDYFLAVQQMLEASPGLIDELAASEGWRVLDGKLPLDDYLIPDVVGGVDFMRAGRFDEEYPKLVGGFDWIEFFNRYGAVIRTFRELLINKYAYTLVDSRTGLTDVSGICTTLLPEKLVGVFTPNRQSLRGLREVVKQAVEYRSKSDDFRPLSVFPLPSRVENAEKDLREQWRKTYQNEFEELLRSLHGSEQCDLTDYFDAVVLPHVSYYAYGENIAVLQERADAISLSGAYQRFFDRLTSTDFAWEVPGLREAAGDLAAPSVETAKPVEEKYDAFLSCVPDDAKEVSQVNYQLRRQGVRCFFALNDVAPGEDAAAIVSKAMAESKTVLMFVGPTGSGFLQDQESVTALENYVKDGTKRIIPVLLPNAPGSDKLRLPNFLRNVQWVDLRSGLEDPQAMGNLIWGLTGKRPAQAEYGRYARGVGVALLAILVLIWIIFTAITYIENRRLVSDIQSAGEGVSSVQSSGNQPPTIDSLRRLDTLRKILVKLRDYNQSPPLYLRWGFYSGEVYFDDARATYFRAFDKVLFLHFKQNFASDARTYHEGDLPLNADAGAAYDFLKAYLLLSTSLSNHNKESGTFLQDFLMKEWKRDLGDMDEERTNLAAQQFAFYSSELNLDDPKNKGNADDDPFVKQARAYLAKFAGIQRFYTSMLVNARQKAKTYRFATAHPDGSAAVHGGTDVDAAFTADGWRVMDQSIQNPKSVQGETWVLGSAASSDLSASDLSAQLRALYETDFIAQWRAFLSTSTVLPYRDDIDAASKLKKLSSNSSPLLELICDVSENTYVASGNIQKAFSAAQQVVSHGCNTRLTYSQPSNNAYIKGLFDLQTCVQDIADAPPDQKEAKKQVCMATAKQSLLITGQLEQSFPTDPDGKVDQKISALLEAPIKPYANFTVVAGGPSGLCDPLSKLLTAYPFNAKSTRDITLDEFNALFQPGTGVLSKFINDHKAVLSLQGAAYVQALGTKALGPVALRTINVLYAIQQAVYPNNSKDPQFEYSVTSYLPDAGGFKSEKLSFDGQEWTIASTSGTKKFIWPGPVASGATLSLNNGGGDLDVAHYDGLWSVSHILSGYRWKPSGSNYTIQGPLMGPGGAMTSGGKAIEVRFDIDFKGVPFFQAGYLSGYACPANLSK